MKETLEVPGLGGWRQQAQTTPHSHPVSRLLSPATCMLGPGEASCAMQCGR